MNVSKTIILKLVNDALTRAVQEDRRATADHAAAEAGHKVWDRANPEDGVGGISVNPYSADNVIHTEERMQLARANHDTMRTVYEYAVATFI